MFVRVLLVCVLAAHAHAYINRQVTDKYSTPPLTRSCSGVFRGSWLTSRHGRVYQAYRGIRYAEAPVGKLRFQPPVKIKSYKQEVDATQDGPACPQPMPAGYPMDEDCLRLNVYTPDNNSKLKLPVMVYFHAGGFYSASGRSDVGGSQHLLDRNLVLVTVNYRLATLGFLSTGDKYAPGNNGYKDQVIALKWVQRNIAAFGGDPVSVTICGYCSGAYSVLLHTLSPMSKGLFKRAVSMGGSPFSQIVIPKHQKNLAIKQARLLNCPTNSSKAIVDCLRTKTWKELGNSLGGMFEFGYNPMLLWIPVVEEDFGQERFVPCQPLQALCRGDMQQVPFMVSQNENEVSWNALDVISNTTLFNELKTNWSRIAPIIFFLSNATDHQLKTLKQAYLGGNDIAKDSATADGLGKLFADSIIGFGVHRLAKLLTRQSSQPVYFFEFTYSGNNSFYKDPSTKKPIGAVHHDELIYLFNKSASFASIPADGRTDGVIVDKLTAIFYNFVRYGNPNPCGDTPELEGLEWPAMTADSSIYLRIGEEFSLHQDLFKERFQVWEDLFPLDYDTCQ